jgi:hypothetical protein
MKGIIRKALGAGKWGNKTKINLKEILWQSKGRINLDQNMHRWRAVVKTVMNFLGSIKSKISSLVSG